MCKVSTAFVPDRILRYYYRVIRAFAVLLSITCPVQSLSVYNILCFGHVFTCLQSGLVLKTEVEKEKEKRLIALNFVPSAGRKRS